MSDSAVCVDASFVSRLFVGPDDAQAWALLDGWNEQGTHILSPTLLVYELTNLFYRYHAAGHLSLVTTELVLDAMAQLPLRLEPHASLTKAALRIASTLHLPATYDAYYLALAERFDADLWTADARLGKEVGERGPRVKVLKQSTTT